MIKPVILVIDDEEEVLASIEGDLRKHFSSNYRIITSSSGQEALNLVKKLKRESIPIALFLVDQRMPDLTGIAFLEKAAKYFPLAKKILLTAYADTEVAIKGINEIALDYYLMKPWYPPEDHLYPILEEELFDWKMSSDIPYQGIKIIGTLWSLSTHTIKDFLARNQIPYLWLDLERDAEAITLLSSTDLEDLSPPYIFLPDGKLLQNPSLSELASYLGLQTKAKVPFYDLIIIGGGPTGLACAVYASSEGLNTLLIEKEASGGQAGTSSKIENYLGFPQGISGINLARRAVDQARRFGTEILLPQEAVKIREEDSYKYVELSDGSEIGCRAILIATGVTTTKLNRPGVEKFIGAGIYYGAVSTEAINYKGKNIFVIGGANSAGQGAMLLSKYGKKVTLVVRSSSVEDSMSSYLVSQIKMTKNIQVLLNTQLVEAKGSKGLEKITIKENSGKTKTLKADAVFVFIGATPHTGMVADLVARNSYGFILTGPDLIKDGKLPKTWSIKRPPYLLETSIPGIFAAGDVRAGATRRVASVIGEGATAVSLIHQYLKSV